MDTKPGRKNSDLCRSMPKKNPKSVFGLMLFPMKNCGVTDKSKKMEVCRTYAAQNPDGDKEDCTGIVRDSTEKEDQE